MDQEYRDAVIKMESAGVDPEYLLGWQGGYLGHPEREEQRVTEAYTEVMKTGRKKTRKTLKSGKNNRLLSRPPSPAPAGKSRLHLCACLLQGKHT